MLMARFLERGLLVGRGLLLVLGPPFLVGHAVNERAALVLGHWDVTRIGARRRPRAACSSWRRARPALRWRKSRSDTFSTPAAYRQAAWRESPSRAADTHAARAASASLKQAIPCPMPPGFPQRRRRSR